jgi:hypothetical protein
MATEEEKEREAMTELAAGYREAGNETVARMLDPEPDEPEPDLEYTPIESVPVPQPTQADRIEMALNQLVALAGHMAGALSEMHTIVGVVVGVLDHKKHEFVGGPLANLVARMWQKTVDEENAAKIQIGNLLMQQQRRKQ